MSYYDSPYSFLDRMVDVTRTVASYIQLVQNKEYQVDVRGFDLQAAIEKMPVTPQYLEYLNQHLTAWTDASSKILIDAQVANSTSLSNAITLTTLGLDIANYHFGDNISLKDDNMAIELQFDNFSVDHYGYSSYRKNCNISALYKTPIANFYIKDYQTTFEAQHFMDSLFTIIVDTKKEITNILTKDRYKKLKALNKEYGCLFDIQINNNDIKRKFSFIQVYSDDIFIDKEYTNFNSCYKEIKERIVAQKKSIEEFDKQQLVPNE